jgi:FkbM family methyltransferase
MWDLITNIITNNNVNVVYDIGAYKGDFSKKIYGIKPSASIYAFEANSKHKRPKWSNDVTTIEWFNTVLSNTIEEKKFYSLGTTGDSLYKEIYNGKHNENKVEIVTTDTIDNIIKKHNLQLPELIKIDVQGSELDILSRADLSKCVAIHCETPIDGIVYNQGAPSRQEYFSFFEQNGFMYNKKVRDLDVGTKQNRTVVQQDYIFSKVELDD